MTSRDGIATRKHESSLVAELGSVQAELLVFCNVSPSEDGLHSTTPQIAARGFCAWHYAQQTCLGLVPQSQSGLTLISFIQNSGAKRADL